VADAHEVVTYANLMNLKLVEEVTVVAVVEAAHYDAVYDQHFSAAATSLVLPSELTHHVTLMSTNYDHVQCVFVSLYALRLECCVYV